MVSDEVSRAGFPDSLAEVLAAADPFAGPAAPVRPGPVTGEPVAVAGDPAVVRPLRPAPGSKDVASEGRYPCPCACGCGNDTEMPTSEVESWTAARALRCNSCAAAGHFGAAWNSEAVVADTANRALLSGDHEVTGSRTGERIVVRSVVVDPEEAALDRQVAIEFEQRRREEALNRWLEKVPARFKHATGDVIAPEVVERLDRLRDPNGVHFASLLVQGPTGGGKTWTAYQYALSAVQRSILWPQQIRIGTEQTLFEPYVCARPNDRPVRRAELLNDSVRMIVIDDVGTARFQFFTAEDRWSLWQDVVDWAYARDKALVLTSNLDMDELYEWLGERAYDRLKHMIGTEVMIREEPKRAETAHRREEAYQQQRGVEAPADGATGAPRR